MCTCCCSRRKMSDSDKNKHVPTEKEVSDFLLTHPKFVRDFLNNYRAEYPLDDWNILPIIDTMSPLHTDQVDSSGRKLVPSRKDNLYKMLRDTTEHSTVMTGLESTKSKFANYLNAKTSKKYNVQRVDRSFADMNEKDMFMELIRDAASELDVNILCHKILQNINILTKCDRGSLFLARGTKENRYLVSKLFDVTSNSTLEQSLHQEGMEIIIPFGCGIVGTVAATKETINIKDAYQDKRFNKEVDQRTGYRTHSILSMPICDYDGEVIGVAQIMNKTSGQHEFTPEDEQLFKNYLNFCGIGLHNAQLFEMSVHEYKRNEMMLSLARGIFEEQSNLDRLMKKIMIKGRELLKCAHYTVYLAEDCFIDENLEMFEEDINLIAPASKQEEVHFTKCFGLLQDENGKISFPDPEEIKKSMLLDVAKYVFKSAKYLNIADLKKDGRFGDSPIIDEKGFVSKSMLCMPIEDSKQHIIGVTQLVNKLNGHPFNDNDVFMLEAFSLFCGIGIHNCIMYEKACVLMAKKKVALEVLSYHASASQEETTRIMSGEFPSASELHLYSFDFDDALLGDDDTCRSIIRMFKESDLITQFRIPVHILCRWVCSVKKNYRPVKYHNWRHAFNVTQTMFCVIFSGGMKKFCTDLEILTLLVACLCHDLDHRGTNNAFQAKVESPLALLYGTSTMEHHHFDHSVMIINSEGNNILEQLNNEEYQKVLHMLESAILATDLAVYFKKRNKFKELVKKGNIAFIEKYEKDLLRGMMMTACDLGAITKPWKVQRRVAEMIASEFFEQGDIEKNALHEKPIDIMDREKHSELPLMQVKFIDAICIPLYQVLTEVSDDIKVMYEAAMTNREKWQQSADDYKSEVSTEGETTPVPQMSETSDVQLQSGYKSTSYKSKSPFISLRHNVADSHSRKKPSD